MQILAITDSYYPCTDEIATSLRTLLREIQAKGHAVTLIAPAYAGGKDDPLEDIIRVSAHTFPFGMSARRLMKIHRVLELTERLRGWNYDVIHVHTPVIAHIMGVALARRLHVPVVETWHTRYEETISRYLPFARTAWIGALAGWLSRFQCHGVDGVIVPSTGLLNTLEAYQVQRPVTVVPPAIDVPLFRRGDGVRFREAFGIPPEGPTLLYAGELESTSELAFLFAVAQAVRREVPHLTFIVAGGGAAGPYLREQVERSDLRGCVVFVGQLERAQALLDCYRAADCFVHAPSGETQSVPLLEALASGLPAVTTASAGGKERLAEESGVLVAEDNVPHFASQVLRLLGDPDLRARLALAGRQQAQQWSASLAAEQVLDCYRQVIAVRLSAARALAR